MCGFAGIIAFNYNGRLRLDRISAALDAVAHRGPDYRQVYKQNDFAVGHARLSIIDLSQKANQPFFAEDGRSFIIHNGEIFNFSSLSATLIAGGQKIRTHSDTEVVLQNVLQNGPSAFSTLDGFFASAIFDASKKCWYLARDPMGVKPFYYSLNEDFLAFSSEMKGLLAFGIRKEPDWDSLFMYFQLNYIPQPWTAFRNVHQVKPGHYLRVTENKADITEIPFTALPFDQPDEKKRPAGDVTGEFKKLFSSAVEKRLTADVPVGAFLSGGIDSSAVVAMASTFTRHLKTFSIGFSDDAFYDESRYAEKVARQFGTDHTAISLTTNDMLDVIPEILRNTDEPFGDSSALAVYVLSREVRRKMKVVLSGDGGDELLGGYNKYLAEWRIRHNPLVSNIFSLLRPLFARLSQDRHTTIGNRIRQGERFATAAGQPAWDRYWTWCCWHQSAEVRDYFSDAGKLIEYDQRKLLLTSKIREFPGDLNQVLFSDMALVLLSDMLVKIDRMPMAHALEVRSPFLDHELIRFCSSLPAGYKVKRKSSKILLKEAMKGILPGEIINRPKRGFEVPLYRWLNGELKDSLVNDLFKPDYIKQQGIFNSEGISRLLARLFSGKPGDAAIQVWGLMVFQQWWKNHMEA
ncbi:MAG: asparagine synthase (glutamine-hydrolyzing) [Bacteroidetes bacterium]|nr:asparagine synthase (glutamine-hydrolyzing) [Bacteroidota bacterium]